ncbi:MAG: glycosyltransferase family 4 protein [Alcanivorax sp.]
MHILFCHDTFYSSRRDGTVYSYGAFPYELWERRFLPYFESVTVIGRKKKLRPDETGVLAVSSGQNVDHILLPDIDSPVKRFTKYTRMYKRIEEQVERADAVVIRGPVEFGMMAAKAARKLAKPYAIEMCGCAYDKTYYKGDWFNRIYAPVKYRHAQKMVHHADAVMYVTEKFLQQRYPTQGYQESASNVEIVAPPEFVINHRLDRIKAREEVLNLGMIGNFGNGLKGLGVAIDALAILEKKRAEDRSLPDFKFKVLGQGMPAIWQSLLKDHGLDGKVEFCGTIPGGKEVFGWLDDIDIYLQPSFHEGLPRSLVEAMSRGCPSLCSDAGGTQELLSSEFIHERGNAEQLSRHILHFMQKENRQIAARNNFEKAKNYTRETLVPRRAAFWENFAQKVDEVAQKRA